MTNPIIAKVEQWLWSIAIKKGIYAAVKVVISFLTSVKISGILKQFGVNIDSTTLEGSLTTAFTGLLTMLQNWLKVKFNLVWL